MPIRIHIQNCVHPNMTHDVTTLLFVTYTKYLKKTQILLDFLSQEDKHPTGKFDSYINTHAFTSPALYTHILNA